MTQTIWCPQHLLQKGVSRHLVWQHFLETTWVDWACWEAFSTISFICDGLLRAGLLEQPGSWLYSAIAEDSPTSPSSSILPLRWWMNSVMIAYSPVQTIWMSAIVFMIYHLSFSHLRFQFPWTGYFSFNFNKAHKPWHLECILRSCLLCFTLLFQSCDFFVFQRRNVASRVQTPSVCFWARLVTEWTTVATAVMRCAATVNQIHTCIKGLWEHERFHLSQCDFVCLPGCRNGGFHCKNGVCLHKDALSDGQIDCLDGDDETDKNLRRDSEMLGHLLTFTSFGMYTCCMISFFLFKKGSNLHHNNILDAYVLL